MSGHALRARPGPDPLGWAPYLGLYLVLGPSEYVLSFTPYWGSRVLRIAEGEGSAAVERTEARSEQPWEKVKRNQLNTPRYEYNDVYTHGD